MTLRDSVVSGSFGGGVLAAGARATITRCEIVDTRGAAEAVGLQVVRIGALAGELSLDDSVVANTAGVGVLLQASRGTLTRSTVRDTRASADGELGDGVVVDGQWFSVEGKPLDEPRPAWLDVDRAQIERSARVGVVCARITVTRAPGLVGQCGAV